MNVRSILIGLMVSAVLVGVASCVEAGRVLACRPPRRRASSLGALSRGPRKLRHGATGTGAARWLSIRLRSKLPAALLHRTYVDPPVGAAHPPGSSGNPTGKRAPIISLTLAPDNATAIVPAGTFLTNANTRRCWRASCTSRPYSPANPNGEIRGQINIAGGVTAGLATLTPPRKALPVYRRPPGGEPFVVNSASPYDILHLLRDSQRHHTTLAHIPPRAPGVSGPANVVTLTQGTNIYTAPVAAASTPPTALTRRIFADSWRNTYFNVHSSITSAVPTATLTARAAKFAGRSQFNNSLAERVSLRCGPQRSTDARACAPALVKGSTKTGNRFQPAAVRGAGRCADACVHPGQRVFRHCAIPAVTGAGPCSLV